MCRKAFTIPHCVTFDMHRFISAMHLFDGVVEYLTEREVVRSSCWSSIDLHDYYKSAVLLAKVPLVQ